MRVLFLSLLLIFEQVCFAQGVTVNCGSATLGTMYSTSAPSLQPALNALSYRQHIKLINPTSSYICVDVSSGTTTTAPATNGIYEHCVVPMNTESWDNVAVGTVAYLRADQTSCSTGQFRIDFW